MAGKKVSYLMETPGRAQAPAPKLRAADALGDCVVALVSVGALATSMARIAATPLGPLALDPVVADVVELARPVCVEMVGIVGVNDSGVEEAAADLGRAGELAVVLGDGGGLVLRVPPECTKKDCRICPSLRHHRVQVTLIVRVGQIEPPARVLDAPENDQEQLVREHPTLLPVADGVIHHVFEEIGQDQGVSNGQRVQVHDTQVHHLRELDEIARASQLGHGVSRRAFRFGLGEIGSQLDLHILVGHKLRDLGPREGEDSRVE
eukprot:4285368-Prymnesium_polylepis.1